jgi:hypothetical protein
MQQPWAMAGVAIAVTLAGLLAISLIATFATLALFLLRKSRT